MKIRLIGGPKDGEVVDAPESLSSGKGTENWLTYIIDRIDDEFVGIFKEDKE